MQLLPSTMKGPTAMKTPARATKQLRLWKRQQSYEGSSIGEASSGSFTAPAGDYSVASEKSRRSHKQPKKKTNKKCSFDLERDEFYPVDRLDDMDYDEIMTLWYTPSECDDIKMKLTEEVREHRRRMQNGDNSSVSGDCNQFCFRGVEHHVNKTTKKRRDAKQSIAWAVKAAQENFDRGCADENASLSGKSKEEILAVVSRRLSADSVAEALEMGRKDALEQGYSDSPGGVGGSLRRSKKMVKNLIGSIRK